MEESKDNEVDQNWMPLESNPDIINPFVLELGFNIEKLIFQDMFSIDEQTQQTILNPLALILCYPQRENSQKKYDIQDEKDTVEQIISQKLFYMEQYAENACGTIALFHAIINSALKDQGLIVKGSFFEQFIENTKNMNYQEKGKFFQKQKNLKEKHQQAVLQGQTEIIENVVNHFICFVELEGYIYELDGAKKKPINHGKTNSSNFLSDACKLVQRFINKNPYDISFSVLVLSQPIYD